MGSVPCALSWLVADLLLGAGEQRVGDAILNAAERDLTLMVRMREKGAYNLLGTRFPVPVASLSVCDSILALSRPGTTWLPALTKWALTSPAPSAVLCSALRCGAVQILRGLLCAGAAPSQLAVLTPYNAQVKLLRSSLGTGETPAPGIALGDVEVETVDRFQVRALLATQNQRGCRPPAWHALHRD